MTSHPTTERRRTASERVPGPGARPPDRPAAEAPTAPPLTERVPSPPATDFFAGVDEVDRTRHDDLDLYLPTDHRPGERRPAVVFVHGGPVPEDRVPRPRDSAVFAGYGALAAASGLAGIMFDHRLRTMEHYPISADDLVAAVHHARALDHVDPDRVAIWFFSGGGGLAADWLNDAPRWLRAVAWTYPVLAAPPEWPGDGPRFDCVRAVTAAPELPKLLVRVGAEFPSFSATQDAMVTAAREAGSRLEVVELPETLHGYETHTRHEPARSTTEWAMTWVAEALRAEPSEPVAQSVNGS